MPNFTELDVEAIAALLDNHGYRCLVAVMREREMQMLADMSNPSQSPATLLQKTRYWQVYREVLDQMEYHPAHQAALLQTQTRSELVDNDLKDAIFQYVQK